MTSGDLSDAKRRVIDLLKRVDSATAPEVAAAFNTTDTAARQHLEALAQQGLVERAETTTGGRGRPAVRWRLARPAGALFPDRHGDLTVELIRSIRDALGPDALDRVIDDRAARQTTAYRGELAAAGAGVPVQVRRLAELRSAEGYLAEAVEQPDGSMLLIEHHCPICAAAAECQGLCRSELDVFRAALGDLATVERTQHLLGTDTRCAYRIAARSMIGSTGQLADR